MSDYIEDAEALRARYGSPSQLALDKVLSRLDRHCVHFIEKSPFVLLATSGPDGAVDVSPRGDPPGFVQVRDEKTLLIPDRKGNRRLDSLTNLLGNPCVGLLFVVPGVTETLRINGRARICIADRVLADFEVNGRVPEAVLEVTVEEAYLQCAKALIRSHLWDPSRHVPKGEFPSLGKILADQVAGVDAKETEESIQAAYREKLY